ncbi:hypothetical protein HYPBUDRAFT_152302 [Hyphopichia burtonii NRRL Y-1933]|uniref:Potassium channel domain-containing protein n=1 Tax=Hyphopichia burtonii NRRL Y-1933 TaxID=984485 RepID=A0A1E4RPC7_9ASCO|nr:hypothetical protein HYPBUDRAFT_152302 [Hyphopichia burtonii NRRL Y-1933]ODV69130.1 hypothetical protein HYPBUDRAFT_152302 [Hyphopichia burtonii NRRL Y-1933]
MGPRLLRQRKNQFLKALLRKNIRNGKKSPISFQLFEMNSDINGFPLKEDRTTQEPWEINHALSVPVDSVRNLNSKPGEKFFIFWYMMSSYSPLISAAYLSPIGNLILITCLIEHWRVDKTTGETIPDEPYRTALNALSFIFGIIGNIFLLLNFSQAVEYLISQCISIFCWIVAAILLLIDVLLTNEDFYDEHHLFGRSEGFWFAVMTIFFYSMCAMVLSLNFIGYKLKKYPARFNLDNKQRTLMFYTIVFIIWQVIGTVSFAHLIKNISYGEALYYCTVSLLTIGLGDILPKTVGSRIFVLIFSVIGVLIMGLIIAMIRLVVISSAGPTIFWHQIEKDRRRELNEITNSSENYSQEEVFHRMRLIRKKAKLRQKNTSFIISFIVFMLFWLIGGLVFYFVEHWSYFEAIYFCFLCLITIGYGDFAPITSFGRAFFVCWAIAAIPIMTILISSFGDKIYDWADKFSFYTSKIFIFRSYKNVLRHKRKPKQLDEVVEEDTEEALEDEEINRSLEDIRKHFENPFKKAPGTNNIFTSIHENKMREVSIHKEAFSKLLSHLQELKILITDSIETPSKAYDHELWAKLYYILSKPLPSVTDEFSDTKSSPPGSKEELNWPNPYFWLSDKSPLRLPLKEPNYLIIKLFIKLEHDVEALLESEIEYLTFLQKLDLDNAISRFHQNKIK